MPTLNDKQIQSLGFKSLGKNVRISDKASIYNASNISLGDNVRIDDFAVLSAGDGGIRIGSHIHIAVYSSLIGAGSILIQDFSNLSSRVSVYSSSDDYSGASMTNPCISGKYKKVTHSPVVIEKHVIIGCGTVILPGAHLYEGVALGALSLAKGEYPEWSIYAGNPAKFIKERKKTALQLEVDFLAEYNAN
ncbi:acyltransferase [Rheinheimera nanhaiensis]|uniref:acyltransferase n=1 Tax=Rheinheimera nanhaiensis TaxID=1163621 RepID=UPI00058F8FD1|nr:acyltransferase [Rheinheimera nanhaiensis]